VFIVVLNGQAVANVFRKSSAEVFLWATGQLGFGLAQDAKAALAAFAL
jgi:hypothetical protein